jgi:hypothetical protein
MHRERYGLTNAKIYLASTTMEELQDKSLEFSTLPIK